MKFCLFGSIKSITYICENNNFADNGYYKDQTSEKSYWKP